MKDRCKNCPVNCNEICYAQKFNAQSLCNKVDPDHPSFKEAYKAIISDRSCGTKTYIPAERSIENSNKVPEEHKPSMERPSLFQQAKNFGKALTKHVASGMKNVSPLQQEERLSHCNSCEYLDKDRHCTICGCDVDKKTLWASSECPDKPPRWKAILEEKSTCQPCGK